eukprot:14516235-Alexandrium_andersonii.AAC.1
MRPRCAHLDYCDGLAGSVHTCGFLPDSSQYRLPDSGARARLAVCGRADFSGVPQHACAMCAEGRSSA